MNRSCCLLASISLGILASGASLAQMPELSPLPSTGTLAPAADPTRFSFVVAGDSRPKWEKDIPTFPVQQIFIEVSAIKPLPAFLMTLGNTTFGKNAKYHDLIQKQYNGFLADAKDAKVPVFNAPGNDEMDDQNEKPSATMQKWYQEMMGLPFGAFNYGNSRFIVLNTSEIPPAGTKRSRGVKGENGKVLDPGYVSPAQLELLKRDLDANTAKAHIFVFMHHPIKPKGRDAGLDRASAQGLMDLFKGYKNISYVLASHEHLYYNPQDPQNVKTAPSRTDPSDQPPYYLVSGGAGSTITVPREQGGFFHFLVFKVEGNRVDVTIGEPDTSCPGE